jgi:hypothetical protein
MRQELANCERICGPLVLQAIALLDARLGDLVNELDREDVWSQRLSSGEQQRVALARIAKSATGSPLHQTASWRQVNFDLYSGRQVLFDQGPHVGQGFEGQNVGNGERPAARARPIGSGQGSVLRNTTPSVPTGGSLVGIFFCSVRPQSTRRSRPVSFAQRVKRRPLVEVL